MPEVRRLVFRMSRFDAKTYEGIASTLGISKYTVKEHIVLALNFLRLRIRISDMQLFIFCLFLVFF